MFVQRRDVMERYSYITMPWLYFTLKKWKYSGKIQSKRLVRNEEGQQPGVKNTEVVIVGWHLSTVCCQQPLTFNVELHVFPCAINETLGNWEAPQRHSYVGNSVQENWQNGCAIDFLSEYRWWQFLTSSSNQGHNIISHKTSTLPLTITLQPDIKASSN